MQFIKNNSQRFILIFTVFSGLGLWLPSGNVDAQNRLTASDFKWIKGKTDLDGKVKHQKWFVRVKKNCGFTVGYGKNKNKSFVLVCSGDVQDPKKCFEDYQRNIKKQKPKPVKEAKGDHLNCRWKGQPEVLTQNSNEGCKIGVGIAVCGAGSNLEVPQSSDQADGANQSRSQKNAKDSKIKNGTSESPESSNTSKSSNPNSLSSDSVLPPQDPDAPAPKGTIEAIVACQPDQTANPNNCYSDTSIKFSEPAQKKQTPQQRRKKRGSDSGSAF